MRSFQEEHELREIQTRAAIKAAGTSSPDGGRRSPVAPQPASGRVSPVKEAARIARGGGGGNTSARPSSPDGAASAAGSASASHKHAPQPADDVTVFRTNITIAVMALVIILMGMIAVNSGGNASLTRPRAVVVFIDGLSGSDLQSAASFDRVPYLSMLDGVGSTSLKLADGSCTHTVAADRHDSGAILREAFAESTISGSPTVLRAAKSQGYAIKFLGGYPLINDINGAGCGALNAECGESCLGGGSASKCNYDEQAAVERDAEFLNATTEALNEAHEVVVVRIAAEVPADATLDQRHDIASRAQAAAVRTVMRAFERCTETNENLLAVTIAGRPDDRSAYVAYNAFRRGDVVQLFPLTEFSSGAVAGPRVADVAATLATWLDLGDEVLAGLGDRSRNAVLCGPGSQPQDCDLSRR